MFRQRKTLLPLIDEDGILRCDGRLKYAEFIPYKTRFPIILPRRHWVTTLLIKHYHEKGYHTSGTNQTLADLTSRFWIIAGREEIRAWERECAQCRKRKAKPASQVMAPLPRIRVKEPLRAFSRVAIDFAGPIFYSSRKRQTQEKTLLVPVYLPIIKSRTFGGRIWTGYRLISERVLSHGQSEEQLSPTTQEILLEQTRNCASW